MAKKSERGYDASDLKELMDNAGGWAKNWDDILRYLRGPAVYDADFAKDEVPQLIADIGEVRKKGVDFSTDYRKLWHAITGESTKGMKPPEGVRPSATNPVELEDKYLHGLSFPAKKADVLKQAKKKHAPERVLHVLEKIDDREYRDMPRLIEAVGDDSWDHD